MRMRVLWTLLPWSILASCSGKTDLMSEDAGVAADAAADAADAGGIRDATIDRGPFWKPRDDVDPRCTRSAVWNVPQPCDGGYRWGNHCYQRCTRDDECTDPERPFCSIQGFAKGGDYSCNGAVRLCRCWPDDDCPHENP